MQESPAAQQSHAADQSSFGAVAPYYEDLMSAVPYRFWVSYLFRLWNNHGLTHKRVLDLACGTGTVSRMLAARDHSVVGVDLSGPMLEIARRKASEEGLKVDFVQQDAADLDIPAPPFDTVVSLFDSLNYILEPDRLATAFERVGQHIVPGGSFIFDLNTEYAFQEGMFNQSCSRRDEPLHYRWRSRYDEEARICTVRMQFWYRGVSGETETFKEVHRQRAYAKNEILEYLDRAGFTSITMYDAYSMDPPLPKSDRVFYLAVKPA